MIIMFLGGSLLDFVVGILLVLCCVYFVGVVMTAVVFVKGWFEVWLVWLL